MNQSDVASTIVLKHVLYIEDSSAEIYLIQELVERKAIPLCIDFACSLQEALDKFDSSKHVLIITDYNLPDAEAPEIAEVFSKECPDIPLIAISGAYTDDRIQAANNAGIYQCWTKNDLEDCLNKAVSFLSKNRDTHH